MIEFFAHDDDVARIEHALQDADESQRLPLQVALAWQLRQRDTQRALSLANQARTWLIGTDAQSAASRQLAARIQLIEAEANWLLGEPAAAQTLAEVASVTFKSTSDATGQADAHWLFAFLAMDRGDMSRAGAELEAMAVRAGTVDPVRAAVAHAALARTAAFRDVAAAKAHWGAHFANVSTPMHPAAGCWIEDFWGLTASLGSDYVESIRHVSKAYAMSLATGQLRRTIITAGNIGAAFVNLNDCDAALEWMQRSLDLARQSGWPGMVGTALTQTAETLRLLQRFEAAAGMLREALVLMAPVAASRTYAVALRYLGDVELDRKHYTDALETFLLLQQRAVALDQADQLTGALCGQARAHLELGDTEQALRTANAALEVAKSNANHQIAALRVLADIHARNALPPPTGMVAINATLHYLQLALDLSATIESNTVPVDLLEAAAMEYANVGNYNHAFRLAKQAIQARKTAYSVEARNRAHAIQVGHETEKTRLESLHTRQLAQASADRADALERANQAYVSVLENAQDAIVLTDPNGRIKNWNRQAVLSFGWALAEVLDRPIATTIFPERLRRETAAMIARRQLVREDSARTETIAVRRDGSEFPIELSLTTVNVGLQLECSFFIRDISQRRQAELEIAESLAKQLELVELKSRFISMASHEFRTPLALILSSSEMLQHYGERVGEEGRKGYFDSIMQSVGRMKRMLEDVLVIGKSDAGVAHFNPTLLDLRPLCESLITEVKLSYAQSAREQNFFTFRIWDDLAQAEVDERWFRHIFGNLLSNAIKYSPEGGPVVFDISAQPEGLQFLVSDQGIGLHPQDIPRLFESFFRASNIGDIPGTGLGLSIVKRAVELHGGSISVTSVLGQGTTFKVLLPMQRQTPKTGA